MAKRFIFVAYYPEGPHAGPITVGLFGVRDGNLLPVFASREKAIDFAKSILGPPPHDNEDWDGVELPPAGLLQLLLSNKSIEYVAQNPTPSGEVELTSAQEFIETLGREAGTTQQPQEDFRRWFVQSLVYGDVS